MYYFHSTNEAVTYGIAITALTHRERLDRIQALRVTREARLAQGTALGEVLDNCHDEARAHPLLALQGEVAIMAQYAREAVEGYVAEFVRIYRPDLPFEASEKADYLIKNEGFTAKEIIAGVDMRRFIDKMPDMLPAGCAVEMLEKIRQGRA